MYDIVKLYLADKELLSGFPDMPTGRFLKICRERGITPILAQSPDKVHPITLGAQALYAQVLRDLN